MTAGPAPTSVAPVAATASLAQPPPVAVAVVVVVVDAARLVLGKMGQVMLEALVEGRNADGLVTLKTSRGNVQVRTSAALPAGTTLVLELTRNGDQISARVSPATSPRIGAPQIQTPPASAQPAARAPTTPSAARGGEPTQTVRAIDIGRATFPAVALAPTTPGTVSAPPPGPAPHPSTPISAAPRDRTASFQADATSARPAAPSDPRPGAPSSSPSPLALPPAASSRPLASAAAPLSPVPSTVPSTVPSPSPTPTPTPSPSPSPSSTASPPSAGQTPAGQTPAWLEPAAPPSGAVGKSQPKPQEASAARNPETGPPATRASPAATVARPLPATAPPTSPPSPPTSPASPASPDPAIASRAATVYAQARAAMPARDARTPAPSTTPSTAAAGTPNPRATPASVGAPPTLTSTMPAPAGQPPAMASPRLQPGTTLEVRLAQPTARPAAEPEAASRARPLPATVTGAVAQGRLVVDTPIGRLAVTVPPDLLATPPGETLDLEWLPETSRPPPAAGRRTADGQSTRAWPQTREAVAALLAQTDPATRAAADQLVPRPGPRLAQQMMAFVGRADGDLARWLGDALTRHLERNGLAEIRGPGDGGTTREPERAAPSAEWRHVTMPLFDGARLHPVEFRARRRNDGGAGEAGRDQSRFVVDCVHDELGAVQIDGLMTRGGGSRRLDVILRSHAELSQNDRQAIAALFTDACGAMGFAGEIAFQVAEQFPVDAGAPPSGRAVIA